MTVVDRCPKCGAETNLVVVTFVGDARCYTCGADIRDPWALSDKAAGPLVPDGQRRPYDDLVAEHAARTGWDTNRFRFTRVLAGPWGTEELR